MAILNRAIRNARAMMRSAEWGSEGMIPPNSGAAPALSTSPAGLEARALGISTVLSCVKALSDDASSAPFYAYEGDPKGAHQPIAKQPRIVTEPFGPDLDPQSGMGQIVVSIAMRGQGFGYVSSVDRSVYSQRWPLGIPDQLQILHPDAVQPRWKNGRKVFKILGEDYSTDEIIHFTGMMIPGSASGVDVLTAQRINVELAQSVGAYAEGFFGSGGSPSVVISVPGAGDKTKARQVKDTWTANHGGVPNAHQPAVLFGGATIETLSVTPDNAQFLETRRFMREEICGWFSVPLQRIQAIVDNASQGGGAGIDAFDSQYIKHGLLPIFTSIETPWNQLIPGDGRTWTGFDVDNFTRANAKTRADIAQIDRVTGVRMIDEIRAERGMAPLPEGQGQNPFTPLNSNASPTGGADNKPAPGSEGNPT